MTTTTRTQATGTRRSAHLRAPPDEQGTESPTPRPAARSCPPQGVSEGSRSQLGRLRYSTQTQSSPLILPSRGGYTLSDRGTYLAQRQRLGLQVVFEGADEMLNIYHTHVVNPAKHQGVKRAQAEAFVEGAMNGLFGRFRV